MLRYASYFISPHLNDMAFSCYAALRSSLTCHLKPVVVTVFDNRSFSFNANLSDAKCMTRTLKKKYQFFAKTNNCDLISFDLFDSSVRYLKQNAEYVVGFGENAIFFAVEHKLRHVLKEAIQLDIPIYVPLNNSLHLDHIMIRNAVRTIAEELSTCDKRLPDL